MNKFCLAVNYCWNLATRSLNEMPFAGMFYLVNIAASDPIGFNKILPLLKSRVFSISSLFVLLHDDSNFVLPQIR